MRVLPHSKLMDAQTPLLKVPRFWAELIEPRILRSDKHNCWLWQGGVDNEGEPVVTIRNLTSPGGRTTRRLKTLIVEHYWDWVSGYRTFRTCANLNCLRPEHFYVNDGPMDRELELILKQKRWRLTNYERNQKGKL